MQKTPTPRAAVAAHQEGVDRLFSRGGGSGPALHRMGSAVSLARDGGDALDLVLGEFDAAGDWNGACERGSVPVAA